MSIAAGVNYDKPIKVVRHAELKRLSDESPFRSWCPVCDQGLLLVARISLTDLRLSKLDHCSTCGQRFLYEDDSIAGEALIPPIPATLDEAVPIIDAMLSQKNRDFLQKAENVESAAITLHHTFGRYLRNTWGLWGGSPLATHMRTEHKVDHPDDMSHAILLHYARARYRTRWDRLNADDEI